MIDSSKIYSIFLGSMMLLLPYSGFSQHDSKPWTLRACIDHARLHNLQILYAKITHKNEQVNTSQSRAQLFPSLTFSSNQGWGHQKRAQADGSLSSQSAYSGDYALNGNLSLYNGRKRSNTLRQQEIRTKISGYQIDVTGNDTEIAVTEAYLQILYANESLKTNKQILENSTAQLARSKELEEAGSISKSDHAQIEAQYSNDQYRVVQAKNTLVLNKLELKQLLELDAEETFEVIFPDLEDCGILAPAPSLQDVYRTALEIMPEMQNSRLGIESAHLGEKIASAEQLPDISLKASVSTNHDSESDHKFSKQIKDRLSENIGINISLPIFNRRQAKSAIAKARLQTEAAKLDDLSTRKNLLKTVESLQQDLLSAQSRYVAASNSLQAASLSYQLVQEQFNAGMKNTVELLTEKNNYLSALQEQIQAKYQAILARKLLNFYRNEPITI